MVLLSDSARNLMFWAEKEPVRKDKSASDEQAELRIAVRSLLSTLGYVQSRQQLEELLPLVERQFNSLLLRYRKLMAHSLPALDTMTADAQKSSRQNARQAKHVKDLLGSEVAERFAGYVESMAGYYGWFESRVTRTFRGDKTAFIEPPIPSKDAMRKLDWAGIIHGAVMLMLTGSISGWTVEALNVLIEAADDYMSAVENEFLMAKPAPDLSETLTQAEADAL